MEELRVCSSLESLRKKVQREGGGGGGVTGRSDIRCGIGAHPFSTHA